MRTFGGEFSRKQRVSLAGTSKSVESREEILERSRLEREKRRRRKIENEKATVIQSAWRSYVSRRETRRKLREEWVARFGEKGVLVEEANVLTKECVGCMIAFADPEDLGDVERLARVCDLCCRVGLLNIKNALIDQRILWVRDLCQLAIRSLALNTGTFGTYLQQPFSSNGSNRGFRDHHECVSHSLVTFLMMIFSKRSWQGCSMMDHMFGVSLLRPDLRKQAGREMVNYLFEDISDIIRDICQPLYMEGPDQNDRVVPCAETLVTVCLVFYFSAQHELLTGRLFPLMSVDKVFHTCPSLLPLRTKLWCETIAYIDTLYCSSENLKLYIKPKESMEYLLTNLLECLEVVPNSQKNHDALTKSNVSNRSLVVFMALVESILKDEAYWNISAESFVDPLAEADTVIALMNSLQSLDDLDPLAGSSKIRDVCQDKGEFVSIVCSFIARLLSYSNDPVVQTKLTLTLAIKVNMAGLLWQSYLRDNRSAIISDDSNGKWMIIMSLFCETFATALHVFGDEGLYVRGFPLPLETVYDKSNPKDGVLHLLKECLWKIVWKDRRVYRGSSSAEQRMKLLKSGGKLLTLLHDRNGRKGFAPEEAFYSEHIPKESFYTAAVASIERHEIEKMHQAISSGDVGSDSEDEPQTSSKVVDVLQYAYPLIPFLERVKIFQSIVQAERRNVGPDDSNFGPSLFFNHGMSQERFLTVHRGHVLEDAYHAMGPHKSNFDVRKRVRIAFINEFGEQEAGIDGGGVFKEFLESVIKESTSLDVGLFKSTMDNKLYPSPVESSSTTEHLKKIEFVGLMVGKAVWEGILLELPLAPFFLKKFRGAQPDVDDLPSLDPEMAKNLQYLIENPTSLPELGLTFSITETIQGMPRDIELVPGGSSITVTTGNVAHFLHRVANFKLNEQIKAPCDSFLRGFHAIIPKEWVASFNDSELQMLIGGVEGDMKLDLTDLENNVVYSGGYSREHPVIKNFWRALHSMSKSQLADFLRFVTSCPRPPILGFSSLEPPLTIQMVTQEDTNTAERLPTAATCINLLKLPPYDSADVLLTKLLYAIESHAGFDLS